MSMTKSGNVLLAIYENDGVTTHIYRSVKELVQSHFAETALSGSWGSQEQLEALIKTKVLLDKIIDLVIKQGSAED